MPDAPLLDLVVRLRNQVADPADGLADADLLVRYVRERDAVAFEALVWRHSRLVMGVCRRSLRHRQDAEDAFQATFLLLARQAHGIRHGATLAAWLHTTAVRVAGRTRANVPWQCAFNRQSSGESMPTFFRLVICAAVGSIGNGFASGPDCGETATEYLAPEYERPIPPGHVRKVFAAHELVHNFEDRNVPLLFVAICKQAPDSSWESGGGHGRIWYDPRRESFVIVQRPGEVDDIARVFRALRRLVVTGAVRPEALFN